MSKHDKRFKLKYWPTHIVLALFRPIGWLPYRINMALGRWLGRRFKKYGGSMVRNSRVNIQLCYPNLSTKEQQLLLHKNFEALGQGLVECAMSAWPREKALLKLVHSMEGVEHLTEPQKQGHGVLALFPHLTSLYIMAYLLQRYTQLDLSVMYHSPRNPALDYFMRSRIEKYADNVFTRRDLRAALNTLKEKKVVWYAPDIDSGAKASVFAPFCGVPAATLTTPMRMAQATGAKVCLSSFLRREDGKGYDIKIFPPIDNFPSGNDVHDATRINQQIEAIIAPNPEQYMWQMKRFNTRPKGEEKVY